VVDGCRTHDGLRRRPGRARLRARCLGLGYVLAARSNHLLTLGSGCRPGREPTKGIRDYDRAMTEITGDDAPDGQEAGYSTLPAPRHRYTRALSHYRCRTPQPVPSAFTIVPRYKVTVPAHGVRRARG
jgi:hypothetical protein